MEPVTVLFFGPQGAGKGTQVKLLMDVLKERESARDIVHIDMGAELRALRDSGTYTGKLTGEVIDAGHLMPDFMPVYLTVNAFVERLAGSEHIVADSVARRPNQATAFDDAMQFYGRPDYHVIDIQLSEEESIKRLLLRGRNDDTEEAIRNRLGWHKTEVAPLLRIFEERGRMVHHIDGDDTIENVHKDVMAALNLA